MVSGVVRSLQRFRLVAVLLALILHPACTPEGARRGGAPKTKSTESGLFLQDDALWPVGKDGFATIRVCWKPLDLGDETLPDNAPDLDATMATRREWVEEVVEQEWNARTPIHFVGWKDCDGSQVDLQIQPIGSGFTPVDCQAGQPCVDQLGARGTTVFLNMMTVVEVGSAIERVIDGRSTQKQISDGWGTIFFPFNLASQLNAVFDQPTPENLDALRAVEKVAMQETALHELGHAAGFGHEQYRGDDVAKQEECIDRIKAMGGTADLIPEEQLAAEHLGNHPLGAFDLESIMSYCRSDRRAVLSDIDVAEATKAYGGGPKPASTEAPSGDDDDATSTADEEDDEGSTPSKKKSSKTSKTTASVPSGGCLGN